MTPTPKTWHGAPIRITDDNGNTKLLEEIDGVAIRAIELLMRHRGMLTDRH
jgi:hypothetical protein